MKKLLVSICVAALLMTGCGGEKTAEQPKPSSQVEQTNQSPADEAKVKEAIQETTQAQSPAPAKVLNLGMTLDQFKSKFAESAKVTGGPEGFNLNGLNAKQGDAQDLFSGMINERLAVQGTVDKSTGLMKEIWLMSQPQSKDDYMLTIIVYSLIISVLNPELSPDERGELLGELKLTDRLKELHTSDGEALRGNVRYKTMFIQNGILGLYAEPKDL